MANASHERKGPPRLPGVGRVSSALCVSLSVGADNRHLREMVCDLVELQPATGYLKCGKGTTLAKYLPSS